MLTIIERLWYHAKHQTGVHLFNPYKNLVKLATILSSFVLQIGHKMLKITCSSK